MSIRNNGRERKHFKLTEKDKQYIRETCKKMRIEQVNENEPAIDECAFKGNEVLTSYVIPENVTKIGRGAFQGCASLASVVIPSSVTVIASMAFFGCCALTDIRYNGTKSQWADVYKGGHWYKYTAAQAVHCSDGDVELEPFVVENGVFEDCLILPNSEYVIPDGITAIGSITMTSSGAFEECYGLKSIVLPNSLEAIGHNAFMVCLSLESIEIPIGVTQIGTYAFLGCASLEELRYAGTTKQWANVEKGSNWNMQSGIKVVHCLDGDVEINE